MPFELECVHAPSRQITFLDTTITVDLSRRKIITNIYDKRSGMACYKNARTFPHRDSLLVESTSTRKNTEWSRPNSFVTADASRACPTTSRRRPTSRLG